LNVNGIGLGLVISKQIVEKFEGKISFESKEDEGSTFMFTFKLRKITENINKNSENPEELNCSKLI
jgi:signal transduction histidine kinase